MDFIDQLKQFSKRVESMKDTLQTEEATKTAIIMPFFAMLGYDVFNPREFVPEYTADVGIKKGEKVDYAILQDGEPVILIECKSITEDLAKHDSQLFRYFGTSSAKFAILTNGLIYRFYTDLEDKNKMDKDPFLTVNILDVRDSQVSEIKKFCKADFDVDAIFNTASKLKYAGEFKRIFMAQLENPSDDFTRLFLQGCYSGQKTQAIIDKFRPILRDALNYTISELMNDKIKFALGGSGGSISVPETKKQDNPVPVPDADPDTEKRAPKIATTEEELEAFSIVKNLLHDIADIKDFTYKDTESYFSILYKGNIRKWICRVRLTDTVKTLILPTPDKKEIKYQLQDVYDIQHYSDELVEVLKRYL